MHVNEELSEITTYNTTRNVLISIILIILGQWILLVNIRHIQDSFVL